MHLFFKLYDWKIAFINMAINTVIIIIEKNVTEFKVFQFKFFV